MTTIWSFPAGLIGYISGAGALATISLCYVLAVSLGHVEPWLPMISACGNLPPECFLFRAGLVLSGAVFWLEVVAVFNTEAATTKREASLVFGTLSAIGLMVIGVVSDKEASTIHTGFAIATLLSTEVYMILVSTRSHQCLQFVQLTIQQLCACYCGAAIIVAAVLSGIDYKKYQVYVALCEWTGVATICFFLMALSHNLADIQFWEVWVKTKNAESFSSPKGTSS